MKALACSRGVVLTLASLFGVSLLALGTVDSGTLTIGGRLICDHGILGGVEDLIGFSGGLFGSYSPIMGPEGPAAVAIWDNIHSPMGTQCPQTPSTSLLQVSGFTADPGKLWLNSIECGGDTKTGSNAASFSYDGGIAIWTWAQVFGLNGKSQVSCKIDHK